MAVELEIGLAVNLMDSIASSGGSGSGLAFYQIPTLANLVLHLPTNSRFKPLIGAGIGGMATQLEDYDLFYGRCDGDFGFAWQGFA